MTMSEQVIDKALNRRCGGILSISTTLSSVQSFKPPTRLRDVPCNPCTNIVKYHARAQEPFSHNMLTIFATKDLDNLLVAIYL